MVVLCSFGDLMLIKWAKRPRKSDHQKRDIARERAVGRLLVIVWRLMVVPSRHRWLQGYDWECGLFGSLLAFLLREFRIFNWFFLAKQKVYKILIIIHSTITSLWVYLGTLNPPLWLKVHMRPNGGYANNKHIQDPYPHSPPTQTHYCLEDPFHGGWWIGSGEKGSIARYRNELEWSEWAKPASGAELLHHTVNLPSRRAGT